MVAQIDKTDLVLKLAGCASVAGYTLLWLTFMCVIIWGVFKLVMHFTS